MSSAMRGQWLRLLALVARDGAIVLGVLALWGWLLAQIPAGAEYLVASVITALLTTALGYLAHEWGHLLGAIGARAAFELPRTPFESFFLFRFDRGASSRAQFFAMALGGFAASIVSVPLFVWLLPRGVLASALTLALVGLGVVATLVIEVPEFWRAWRGGPLPDGAAFVTSRAASRDA